MGIASPGAAEAFLAATEAAAARAHASAAGQVRRDLSLAGERLRLDIAGSALAEVVLRPLAHLARTAAHPLSLEVAAWDAAATGVALPRPTWGREAYGPRSEIDGCNDGSVHVAFQADTGSLLAFDVRRRRAFYATQDAARLPNHETAAPLRTILHWWTRQRGLQMVHAAAVGDQRGALLLAGEGGAGKSSTALACLGAGLGYLGDDYCLLDLREARRPDVHAVYGAGKLTPAGLRRLPFLEPLVADRRAAGPDKAVVFVAEHAPAALIESLPVRAIALPRVGGGRETTFAPASPAQALIAMAPSTHVQLPNAGPEVVRQLGRLVRTVPAFRLDLGSDPAGVASACRRLLESVFRAGAA